MKPAHKWPFIASEVKRTALVRVLSDDEPANEAHPDLILREWPMPRSFAELDREATEDATEDAFGIERTPRPWPMTGIPHGRGLAISDADEHDAAGVPGHSNDQPEGGR